MVLVNLQGGLGNQMFQYAAARGISGKKKQLYLDCGFLEANTVDTAHFTARTFALGIFANIRSRRAKSWQIKFFKSHSRYYRILNVFFKSSIKLIRQQENEYIPPSNIGSIRHLYIDGYFQSELYFKHIRTDIINEFAFPALDPVNELLKKKIMAAPDAISLHIRRGDYLKSENVLDTHGILPPRYYEKALDLLREKCPVLTLFIFSDDIAWAKQNICPSNIELNFIYNNTGDNSWKDMALMSFCRHHIVANSSFSWWGAWLSVNKGFVFAPQKWFNPLKVKFNIHDFVPDNWIIVDYD